MRFGIITQNHIIVNDFVQLHAIRDTVGNLRNFISKSKEIKSALPVAHAECSLCYNCRSGVG